MSYVNYNVLNICRSTCLAHSCVIGTFQWRIFFQNSYYFLILRHISLFGSPSYGICTHIPTRDTVRCVLQLYILIHFPLHYELMRYIILTSSMKNKLTQSSIIFQFIRLFYNFFFFLILKKKIAVSITQPEKLRMKKKFPILYFYRKITYFSFRQYSFNHYCIHKKIIKSCNAKLWINFVNFKLSYWKIAEIKIRLFFVGNIDKI